MPNEVQKLPTAPYLPSYVDRTNQGTANSGPIITARAVADLPPPAHKTAEKTHMNASKIFATIALASLAMTFYTVFWYKAPYETMFAAFVYSSIITVVSAALALYFRPTEQDPNAVTAVPLETHLSSNSSASQVRRNDNPRENTHRDKTEVVKPSAPPAEMKSDASEYKDVRPSAPPASAMNRVTAPAKMRVAGHYLGEKPSAKEPQINPMRTRSVNVEAETLKAKLAQDASDYEQACARIEGEYNAGVLNAGKECRLSLTDLSKSKKQVEELESTISQKDCDIKNLGNVQKPNTSELGELAKLREAIQGIEDQIAAETRKAETEFTSIKAKQKRFAEWNECKGLTPAAIQAQITQAEADLAALKEKDLSFGEAIYAKFRKAPAEQTRIDTLKAQLAKVTLVQGYTDIASLTEDERSQLAAPVNLESIKRNSQISALTWQLIPLQNKKAPLVECERNYDNLNLWQQEKDQAQNTLNKIVSSSGYRDVAALKQHFKDREKEITDLHTATKDSLTSQYHRSLNAEKERYTKAVSRLT